MGHEKKPTVGHLTQRAFEVVQTVRTVRSEGALWQHKQLG